MTRKASNLKPRREFPRLAAFTGAAALTSVGIMAAEDNLQPFLTALPLFQHTERESARTLRAGCEISDFHTKHLQTATVPAAGALQVHLRFESTGPPPTSLIWISLPSPSVARRDVNSARAAAREGTECIGKSPGFTVPPALSQR